MLYGGLGYGDHCIPDLERALELDPQNPNVHYALASCLLISGEWDRAEETATQGAAQGNPGGYILAIQARYQQGDIEGALQNLVYAQEELGIDNEVFPIIGSLLSGRIEEDELTDEQIEAMDFLGAVFLLKNPEPTLQRIAERAGGEIGWGQMGSLFSAGYRAIRSDPRFIDYLDRSAILDVWRELGPPAGCRAVGETFTCAAE